MSIAFNDNHDIRAPKHIDARAIVGSNPLLLYDTKEDIPLPYRYETLTTYDDDAKQHWQLIGGTTDDYWVQINGASLGIITFSQVINTQIVNLGDSTFDGVYTILFYNGIFINPSLYNIVGDELRFSFTTEVDDEIYLVGFTATIVGGGGGGGSNITPYKEEFLVPSNGQTVFTLINTLEATAMVYINGGLLMSNQYSGTGTTTLTLNQAVTDYDTVVVIGNIITA